MLEEIILKLYELPEHELTEENLHNIKKQVAKKYNVKNLPTNIQLQKVYNLMVKNKKIKENKKIKFLLMKRKIRSLS